MFSFADLALLDMATVILMVEHKSHSWFIILLAFSAMVPMAVISLWMSDQERKAEKGN